MISQFVRSVVLRREKVASFDQYPFCLPAIKSLQQIDLHSKVTFFVGENGSGKSTLLEEIAVALGFNAEGGSKNFRFDTRRSHSILNEYLRIIKGVKRPRTGFFLRAESFFNVATHSPILMAYPDACIYRCDKDGLTQVAYQDTDHFKVTREFLANPERMLRILLER
jgi:predicted ATPase